MKKYLVFTIVFSSFTWMSCAQSSNSETSEAVISPTRIDANSMSGLGLNTVTDPKQPERKLFQRNLYRGPDISVYVVSSESASAQREDLGIDEFLFLINGGAKVTPKGGIPQHFYKGDFFVVPRGFNGEWETIGGTNFHHELSVITTKRNKAPVDLSKIQPRLLDKYKLSGIGITKLHDVDEEYRDTLFNGHEIDIEVVAESTQNLELTASLPEQLIGILAGSLTITTPDGNSETFYTGDFFVLPAGFVGKWQSSGHHLMRSIRVKKAHGFTY